VKDGEAVAGVEWQGVEFGNPVQIEGAEGSGDAAELADVVAEKVYAGDTECANFGNGGGKDLLGKKVAEEKIDGLAAVFVADVIECGSPSAIGPGLRG
jgi:hypothetical protein